jgi:hypothetical protein
MRTRFSLLFSPPEGVRRIPFVTEKSVKPPVFEVEPFDEFCKRPLPEAQWLVEPFFELDSQVVLWGEPGCGKSFLALSWAMAIATGEPWLGEYPVRQGKVLYCAGEGGRGMRRRGAAAQLEYGYGDIPNLNFLTVAPRLRDPKVLASFMKLIKREQPQFVVIDTLARSMSGDENSAEHMGEWLQAAGMIQQETKACVMTLHHTAKNIKKGGKPSERGSGALRGALDTSIMVRKGECITVTCVKQKDEVPFADLVLQLKTIELMAATEEKRALRSAVIIPFEETIPESILADGPRGEALRVLVDSKALSFDEWREACGKDGKITPKSTFYRWVKKLEDEELVELNLASGEWEVKKSTKA